MLKQHFNNLHSNLTTNSLLGLVVLAGMAFYFLQRGKFIINFFHHFWLPSESQKDETSATSVMLPPDEKPE